VSEKVRLNIMVSKEIYNRLLKYIYEKKTVGEKINISKAVEQAIIQYLGKGEQNE
jgi:post-segregation antitoxin (ccd killing protein)